jgi:hypothetical protein
MKYINVLYAAELLNLRTGGKYTLVAHCLYITKKTISWYLIGEKSKFLFGNRMKYINVLYAAKLLNLRTGGKYTLVVTGP